MFGTKKILAKIINGQLVIRVGGGYMNADEFIEQYGKIEMMKLMKLEETKKNEENGTTHKTGMTGLLRSSTNLNRTGRNTISSLGVGGMSQNQLKEQMRNTLLNNVSTYNTNKDDMAQSLTNSKSKMGSTSRLGNTRQSVQLGQDCELKNALDDMKSKIANTPSKGHSRRMTISQADMG